MMKYRGKKKCMQVGGQMPRRQDFPDNESYTQALDAWHASQQQPDQSIGTNQAMLPTNMMNASNNNQWMQTGSQQMGIPSPQNQMAGNIEPHEFCFDKQGNKIPCQKENYALGPVTPGNPYQQLQNVGIGMKAFGALAGELSGRVERGRQNKRDYRDQSALGLPNPMQLSDFQPQGGGVNLYAQMGGYGMNPFSHYSKYGGNLKTVLEEYNKWSNDAGPMDMTHGTGNPELKKGGYEIDRMLIVRKILPELLKLGRMGGGKYRNYKKGGLTANKAREILHDGTANGKPLTDKQRRFFGAKSKGHTNYRGK